MKVVCQNKKAYHDYFIEDTLEAGIVLSGTEVKSLRAGHASIKDSHVIIKNGEPYLLNGHINPYTHGNIHNLDPLRTRKLLLHAKEIDKIQDKVSQKGYTLVALSIYFKGPYAKVQIGLARGKKLYEKREVIKEKEARREIDRALKSNNR